MSAPAKTGTSKPQEGVMSYERFFQMAVTLDAIYWIVPSSEPRARIALRNYADELRNYGRQCRAKASGDAQ